jgi:competence protein ComEC
MLEIKGYTEIIVKESVSLKRPLFYFYETEKLLYDVSFSLSPYDLQLEKISHETNVIEKSIKYIKDFSQKLKDIIRKKLNEPYATIASGVTLGDTNSFTQEVKQRFVNSGLIHLMVLSGTNVTILIFTIWFLLKNFSIKRRTFLTLTLVWIFIFMTGLNPPATRAAIMGSFVLLGNVLGRKINLIHLLSISLFILALIDVNSLFYNPSLHLSFLATFALFIMAPEIYKMLNIFEKEKTEKNNFQFEKKIKIFISVSLSIFLTTTPYILAMVGKFGTAGLLLTFASEPITFIIMFSSFLLIISNILLPEFLSDLTDLIFVNLAETSANIFYTLAKWGAEYFPTINFSLSKNFVILYFAILISIFIFLHKKK